MYLTLYCLNHYVPFFKEYESVWFTSIGLERLCSSEVGATFLWQLPSSLDLFLCALWNQN